MEIQKTTSIRCISSYPKGWPKDIAPPWTFTTSVLMPRIWQLAENDRSTQFSIFHCKSLHITQLDTAWLILIIGSFDGISNLTYHHNSKCLVDLPERNVRGSHSMPGWYSLSAIGLALPLTPIQHLFDPKSRSNWPVHRLHCGVPVTNNSCQRLQAKLGNLESFMVQCTSVECTWVCGCKCEIFVAPLMRRQVQKQQRHQQACLSCPHQPLANVTHRNTL